ncbi:hypothetical protein MYG64_04720 [Ensifer adhaerens]|uniref:hypothetical protein n=1 Tax=Ensifer adhaerens TaxID=106592 RepID=UPI00210130EA|nr:hypothetical protein [Ensifer adhaerens]UTV37624.1 hypothetical protein MYG64_04720 [Ensifer adhaerens]
MSQIRLFIVTNDPERALGETLGCATTNAPDWCRVVTDPVEILRLPDGAKCIGAWFGPGASPQESAWRERRLVGGIVFLVDEDWQRLSAWIAKRRSGEAVAPAPSAVPPPAATTRPNLVQQFT